MNMLTKARISFLAAILAGQLYGQAGSGDAQFRRFPFETWATENAKPQIAWEVDVAAPYLFLNQRLMTRVNVAVDNRELVKHRDLSRMFVFVRMEDSAGHRYQAGNDTAAVQIQGNDSYRELHYAVSAFVVPGDYTISVAICDGETMAHSFLRQRLHVAELSHDPLADAWHGLPAVEFLPEDVRAVAMMPSRVRLPIRTQGPARLELLVNTTPSELNSVNRFRLNIERIEPALKVLMGIEPIGGSVGLTVADLSRHLLTFEWPDLKDFDWVQHDGGVLHSAVNRFSTGSVDAKALSVQSQMLRFFADEATHLAGTPDPAVAHVLIVLSGPAFFKAQEPPPFQSLPRDPARRVFYIRLGNDSQVPNALADNLEPLLKPMGARVFRVVTPEEFRRALGTILDEIAKIQIAR